MIVRESPKAKSSPDKSSANWPPKSPYEALLSSPSGRKKWQERGDRRQRTPSPSPRRGRDLLADPFEFNDNDDQDDGEDEDEETLRLKLQAIEAKLKLKKLQAKAKQTAETSQTSSPRKRPRLDNDIQVPVSPVRAKVEPQEVTSPARVLLGIDKGWKAQDVSLKRPRPAGGSAQAQQHPFARTPPRVKSFTERLAESRTTELEQQQKAERIQNARGHSFSLQSLQASTASAPAPPSVQKPSLLAEARSRVGSTSASSSTPSRAHASSSQAVAQAQAPSSMSSSQRHKASAVKRRADDAATIEPFSDLHLSKRQITHAQLAEAFQGKELYPFRRLLKEVKSPEYDAPDCEADYIVFGIIASKSKPLDIKTTAKTRGDNSSATDRKFMVLHLTDLEWEVDLYLFGAAFGKYWKMSVGTAVAILNPEILPPRPHAKNSGKFSLKLSSSADSVIELGQSRDLGFCTSLRKDGTQCNDWIDTRTTEHCTYHVNLQLDRSRSSRMELATVAAWDPSQRRGGGSGRKWINSRRVASPERKPEPGQHAIKDHDSGERYYMGPATASAAKLLDAADELGGAERMRRHLAEREKEKTLRDKLAALGNGAGATYLRAAEPGLYEEHEEQDDQGDKGDVDARSLGLVARADQVRLSPVRGRKRPLDMGEGMGWAGAGKRGLLDKKMPVTNKARAVSPVKADGPASPRKTRFTLDRGIRVPGRDSMVALDSSDDELDIVGVATK